MKRITARLAMLAAGSVVPAAIATSAMAATDPSVGQAAGQLNGTHQDAMSKAMSFQVAPTTNVQIAVLSPNSNNGDVTQAPSSNAASAAVNTNDSQQQAKQLRQDPAQDPPKDPSQDPGSSQAQQPGQASDPSGQPGQASDPGGQPGQASGSSAQPTQGSGASGQPGQGSGSSAQPSQGSGASGQPGQGSGSSTQQPSQTPASS